MARKPTVAHKNETPFEMLVSTIERFVRRLRKRIKIRIVITAVSFVIGTVIIVWALVQDPLKDLGSAGAAMIGVGGIFYGTIVFGLIQGILPLQDKLGFAKDLGDEMEGYAKNNASSPYIRFEDTVSKLLTLLFT